MILVKYEILKDRISNYCNVNAIDLAGLKENLEDLENADISAIFRAELREAIDAGNLSAEDYEDLTGEDFDSDEDMRDLLRGIFAFLYKGGAHPWRERFSRCTTADRFVERAQRTQRGYGIGIAGGKECHVAEREARLGVLPMHRPTRLLVSRLGEAARP